MSAVPGMFENKGPRLSGKVAVVTAASSGHGRASAMAREGAAVVCADLRKSAREGGFETCSPSAPMRQVAGLS